MTYLAVLACAYGPLMAAELNEIASAVHAVPLAFRTEEALIPLRRFVIGTGRASQTGASGFVLSHPRLRDFLRDDYFDPDMVAKAGAAFASWGVALLRRMAAPGGAKPRVPPYALEYLAHHLEEQAAPSAVMMTLTDEPWMRAWEALEGGYRGFSQDVARARHTVEQRGSTADPCFAWRLRCALIISSIASSGARVPPPLLVRGVAEEVVPLRQALHWAD